MLKNYTPDEAFFENLTLGLKRTLVHNAQSYLKYVEDLPRICDVTYEKREPCDKVNVITWEQRHGVYLPDDMKKFYLSTDGFLLQWSYQYAANDVRRVGFIHIPRLVQLILLRENIEALNYMESTSETLIKTKSLSSSSLTTTSSATIIGPATSATSNTTNNATTVAKDQWGNPKPTIGPKTKIFEINVINGMAKVCLIYDSTGTNNPKIYLLELGDNLKWVFLADTFSEYLRMAIAHLGLPYWELCFASCGLPSWTEQLFLLLAPHLLEEREPRRTKKIQLVSEHPYNILDLNVFRIKHKSNIGRNNVNVKR